MFGINLFRNISSKATAPKFEQALNAAKTNARTKVRTDVNTGTVYMERIFNGKLYKTETKTLENGVKKTTTRVYGDEGKYIGQGGDEGLSALRETEVKRTKEGSVLGGDRVEINKKYHETMGMVGHNINIAKDFDSNGVLQHMEGTTKYRHWSGPKKATIDKVWAEESLPHSAELMFNPNAAAHTKYKHYVGGYGVDDVYHRGYSNYHQFATEGTTYTRALENLKVAAAEKEAARVAEAKAKQIAEQEAMEVLKATQPRVNIGKVFNRNLDEFKCVESTKADGSIVRRYYDPKTFANGKSNPMITTIDKGNYHEELIYDPIKGIKISYKQLGENEPEIEMLEGMRFRYSSKMKKFKDYYGHTETRRVNSQVYDDGLNHVEFKSAGYPDEFKLHVKNPKSEANRLNDPKLDPDYLDVRGRNAILGGNIWETATQNKLDEISKEAKGRWKDLMDFFKPYQP